MDLYLELTPKQRSRLITDLEGLMSIDLGGPAGSTGSDNAIKVFLDQVRFKNDIKLAQDEAQFIVMCLSCHGAGLDGTIEPEGGLDHDLLAWVGEAFLKQLQASE